MSGDLIFFNYLRRKKREWSRQSTAPLTQAEVDEANAVLKARDAAKAAGGPATAKTPEKPSTVPQIAPTGAKGPLAMIVGAVAATSLFASIPKDEGLEYKAYRDIAGVLTICSGDTANVRAGMVESPEGCQRRLEAQLVAHARPVMDCSPRLREEGRDWQRAAAVSLAYNIGVRAFCHSTVDRRFDAGDFKGGCDAILRWNKARVNGQLRPVRGLTLRRERERQLCLRGIT